MPKPTDYDKTHLRNLAAIGTRIDRIFKKAAEEAAKIGVSIKAPLPEDRIFSFDDYPETQKHIERLLTALQQSMETSIVNGVRSAWTLSNNKNNALVSRIFGNRIKELSKEQYRRYFSSNGAALEAFLQRQHQGLNLSDRVWKYTNAFKREIEMGLDLGIRSGESAAQMTRSLRQYLQHPDKLFRRVRDEHGILRLSQAAKEFHPGQGVYRSSYKNARRLACTETNIAYRTSDHLRWQQMDFVVGIEVRLSNNHTLNGVPLTDICDTLKGRYPKDFKFTGWHPHCRCHAVSILKTEEEMANDTQRILAGEEPTQTSVNTVSDVPAAFKDWVEEHSTRIEMSGNLPYFVKDNRKVVDRILGIEPEVRKTSLEIAAERHAIRDASAIQEAWNKRRIDNIRKAISEGLLPPECLESIVSVTQSEAALRPTQNEHINLKWNGMNGLRSWIAKQYGVSEVEAKEIMNTVRSFTMTQYEKFRAVQRGDTLGMSKAQIDNFTHKAEVLEILIDKSPRWSGTTYRGALLSPKELSEIITNLEKGSFNMGGMASWTDDLNVAIRFSHGDVANKISKISKAFGDEKTKRVVFVCDKHFNAASIAPMSARPGEREILASQRCKYRFIKKEIKDGCTYIHITSANEIKQVVTGLSQNEFDARIALLQKVATRHKARTSQDLAAIKDRWAQKQLRDKHTRLMADNVLKLRSEYPHDVDFSALEKLIADNNLTKMREEAKRVAQSILTIRNEEKALADLIPDAHGWHKTFSLSELRKAHEAIKKTFARWKWDYSTETSLKFLHGKLKTEIAAVTNSAHSTREIAKQAFEKRLKFVKTHLENLAIKSEIEALHAESWSHKSTAFKKAIGDALYYFDKGDYDKAKASLNYAKQKKASYEAKKAAEQTKKNSEQVTSIKEQKGHETRYSSTPERIEQIKNMLGCNEERARAYYTAVQSFSFQWDWEIRQIQCGNTRFKSRYGHDLADIEKRAKDLEEFIANSPKWKGGATYRGMSLSDLELNDILSALNSGTFNNLGSASWTTKESVSRHFSGAHISEKSPQFGDKKTNRVVLVLREQKHATSIQHLSRFKDEAEVLASKNNRYRFVSKTTQTKNGKKFIYIEVEAV